MLRRLAEVLEAEYEELAGLAGYGSERGLKR